MKMITVISGSYGLLSRLNGLVDYAVHTLKPAFHVSVIHVHQLPPAALIAANSHDPEITAANCLVAESDGVIVVTPTFKAAYSGILKTYLDLLPQHALADKVVLPLAIGGSPAHVLVLNYALQPVLSELGAQRIIHGVYVLDRQISKNETSFSLDREAAGRLDPALQQFAAALEQNPLHTLTIKN
ncbi:MULTISPECIES: NADPH-dependent FMN reductase [unclassified Sporolactobacillus]|uniref:NADPH-dependent FMN reductase n=1 Tax=unclassified Sporolactobacillus TaxID=2628533 RepID=UPI002368DCA5|nr:NADPH-dependent FMN reductase [Sporolactobacillus sp. CQH2019]MDD9147425.1 NADPH-dependent FMN reductase [Sporolactobacillus sp. CQH2019]